MNLFLGRMNLKVENNIKSIFENTIKEKVNSIDKTCLEQTNEDI